MGKDTLIVGEAPAGEIIRTIYASLDSVEQSVASIVLSAIAGALRFGEDPQTILRKIAAAAPGPEEWAEMEPAMRLSLDGDLLPDDLITFGRLH